MAELRLEDGTILSREFSYNDMIFDSDIWTERYRIHVKFWMESRGRGDNNKRYDVRY